MSENICWGPTKIYIKSATFQYFHQWHLLTSSKMLPSKLCWWQYYVYLRQTRFCNLGPLRHELTILSKWFYNNFMVCNPGKRSFMLLGVDDPLQTSLVWGDQILEKTIQEKVVGVTDNKFNFATHLLNITKNANKFNALTWVQKYMTTNQKSLYFPPLLNRNLPTVRWYGCFVQNVPFTE